MSDTRFALDERFARFGGKKTSNKEISGKSVGKSVWDLAAEEEEVVFSLPDEEKTSSKPKSAKVPKSTAIKTSAEAAKSLKTPAPTVSEQNATAKSEHKQEKTTAKMATTLVPSTKPQTQTFEHAKPKKAEKAGSISTATSSAKVLAKADPPKSHLASKRESSKQKLQAQVEVRDPELSDNADEVEIEEESKEAYEHDEDEDGWEHDEDEDGWEHDEEDEDEMEYEEDDGTEVDPRFLLDEDDIDVENNDALDNIEIADDEREEFERLVQEHLKKLDKKKEPVPTKAPVFDLEKEAAAAEQAKVKQKQRGICFLSRLSPLLNPSKVRKFLEPYGKIARIYLEREDAAITRRRKHQGKSKSVRYVRGWVEFEDKRKAKRAALILNGTPISDNRRSRLHDDVWTIEYISKMQWSDLVERKAHERRTRDQLIRQELQQAREETQYYLEQAKFSKSLRKLEEGEKAISSERKRKHLERAAEHLRKRVQVFTQKEALESEEVPL